MTTKLTHKRVFASYTIMAITTLFFYLIVHIKTPDLANQYLITVLPVIAGSSALLFLTTMDTSPVASVAVLAIHFLLSAGNAFQVMLGVNDYMKILLVNTLALVAGAGSLLLYTKVIKKKVLVTKEGYLASIYVTTGAILLLFLILLIFGEEINGAKLWIRIKSQTLELSEIIKFLFLILLTLIYNSNLSTKLKVIYGSTALIVCCGVFIILLGEIGTAIVLTAVYIIAFCVHIRNKFSWIMLGIFAVLLIIALGVIFGTHDTVKDDTGAIAYTLNKAHERITQSDDYHSTTAIQGLIHGGLFGADLSYTVDIFSIEADFSIAGISMYMGLAIMLPTVLMIAVLYYCVYLKSCDDSVNNRSRFKLSYILCTAIAVQSLLAFIGNTGGPITGIGLPGLSAGGTQMLTFFSSISLIIYGLLDQKTADYKRKPSDKMKFNRSDYYVEAGI